MSGFHFEVSDYPKCAPGFRGRPITFQYSSDYERFSKCDTSITEPANNMLRFTPEQQRQVDFNAAVYYGGSYHSEPDPQYVNPLGSNPYTSLEKAYGPKCPIPWRNAQPQSFIQFSNPVRKGCAGCPRQ